MNPATAEVHARTTLGVALGHVVEAGGGRTLEQDRASIVEISKGAPASIIVFTRAWEPPLLEFIDFIVALREALGTDASIVVAPVAEMAGSAVAKSYRETWARVIDRIADPRLYLETGAV